MGPAVSMAVKLACLLEAEHKNEIQVSNVITGTQTIIDDVYPDDIEEDLGQRTRVKSTIKISMSMTKPEVELKVAPVDQDKQEGTTRPFKVYERKPKAGKIRK